MLAIEGPKHDISKGIEINGRLLTFATDPTIEGTGGSYWDGSIVLLEFLKSRDLCKDLRILELGCGIGVISICLKALGFHNVVATDLEDVLEVTYKNARKNEVNVQVKALDWFAPVFIESDLILLADCIWVSQLVVPLVNTLKLLITGTNECIICYKLRSNIVHEHFLSVLQENSLVMQEMWCEDNYFISTISLRLAL